jgi:anti-anti-sigma factor
MPSSKYFELEQDGATTIIRTTVATIRHPAQALEFSTDLQALLEKDGCRRLVINLSATHYLGSTAYGALLKLGKSIDASQGKAALCNIHADVLVGANILGLGRIIPIFVGEEEALEAVV